MACFIVPGTEAVVTTIATKIIEKNEAKKYGQATENAEKHTELKAERFSSKLKKLNYLLWGGSGLLAFEHLWHGEIQPFFPFLTAANDTEETAAMLHEMSTVGVTMAALVTAVWGVMVFATSGISKKVEEETPVEE
ncbi:MAG: hypothetical protein K6G88_04240 [Lachnospiraceae bacterium]|nr:hypothetical protein [Lachnospiraceae bacterium]